MKQNIQSKLDFFFLEIIITLIFLFWMASAENSTQFMVILCGFTGWMGFLIYISPKLK